MSMPPTLDRLLARLDHAGDARLAHLEAQFADGQERITGLLALAMTVQRDAVLRASIADDRCALALAESGPYLILDRGKIASSAMAGPPPLGLPLVDLRTFVEASPDQAAAFDRAYSVSHADAERTMLAMRDQAEHFPRETFSRLLRWAPAIAADAYRQTALLQSIFDLGRPRLVDNPRPEALRTHWTHVHLVGHLSMLAVAAEPTAWLADLANAFPWQVWTPSFPLVRERITRLAVRGGWVSARFGVSTVDRYAHNLEAPQLLRVFDAVLALVSLASAFERDRDAIGRELFARLGLREHTATSLSEKATVAALVRSARLALDAPYDGGSLDSIVQLVDTDRDPAMVDDNGTFPAILAMAKLAAAPAEVFFPRERDWN